MGENFLMMLKFHELEKEIEAQVMSGELSCNSRNSLELVWNDFVDVRSAFYDFVKSEYEREEMCIEK